MNSFSLSRLLCFLLLAGAAFTASAFAGTKPDFAGFWAIKIGNRALMAVTLKRVPGSAGRYTGSLATPTHFNTSGANEFFSDIQGPINRSRVVGTRVGGNCLTLTSQDSGGKGNSDSFRFCLGAPGHASLGLGIPGFGPLPLTREKQPLVVGANWDRNRTYFVGESDVSNAEMRRIFNADQKDRKSSLWNTNRALVLKRDAARRKQVRKLLAEGKLHSGKDFERAAFIFQHGHTPDDFLLAHTLAMVAVARGDIKALWISAATLDRYLHSIHQPQIYGTQFDYKPDGGLTQKPYNRQLISDALRRDLGVPSQAEQKVQEKQFEKISPKAAKNGS